MPEDAVTRLAIEIVSKHLDLLANRDFTRLKRALHCSDDELREAHSLICSLNPRPAAEFATTETRYVVPDVVVRKIREAGLRASIPTPCPSCASITCMRAYCSRTEVRPQRCRDNYRRRNGC